MNTAVHADNFDLQTKSETSGFVITLMGHAEGHWYGRTEYFEFNSGCSSVQSESLGRSYTNLKIRMDIQLLN